MKLMASFKAISIVMIHIVILIVYQPFSFAQDLAAAYPWIKIEPGDLSFDQCKQAMKHDSNFWWSKKKCHSKNIRYAAGVVLEPIKANEDKSVKRYEGDIIYYITQYRPQEKLYCEKGGFCWPSNKILLLGSTLVGPISEYKLGDESDEWQIVGSSCETILADKTQIIKFGASDLLIGCH